MALIVCEGVGGLPALFSAMNLISTLVLMIVAQLPALAQSSLPPVEAWQSAVLKGDAAALSRFYSADADTYSGRNRISLQEELDFWKKLQANGLTEFVARALETKTVEGKQVLLLRLSAASGKTHTVASMRQAWNQTPDGWKLVVSSRSAAFVPDATRTLPEPAKPNVALYSDPKGAQDELVSALARAGAEKKRVIAVFGGNWCYDCHVLDATFHSPEFAPLVDANFIVVHVNIGEEGKDNGELAFRLGVAIDRGIPSLAVLEPSGTVVYAQKNGEFEASEKLGPQDVRAFLEAWKPVAKAVRK